MNENMPVGNSPEFKETSLNQEFKFTFSRRQCIILVNTLRPIQLPIADLRSKVLREILEEIEKKAIETIRPNDYETAQETQPLASEVKTS